MTTQTRLALQDIAATLQSIRSDYMPHPKSSRRRPSLAKGSPDLPALIERLDAVIQDVDALRG